MVGGMHETTPEPPVTKDREEADGFSPFIGVLLGMPS